MSRRRLAWSFCCALLAAALVWWLFPRRAPDDTQLASTETASDERRALGPTSDPSADEPATPPSSDSTDPNSDFEPPAPKVRLRGSVIDQEGWGLAQALVGLYSMRDIGHRGTWAVTNEHGGFEFELATPEWPMGTFVGASVVDVGGVRRFDGLVRLEQDVELRVLAPLYLHGFVTTNEALENVDSLRVALGVPARRATDAPHWLGECEVGDDGAFEIATSLDEPTPWLVARVTMNSLGDECSADFDVPLVELDSELGTRLSLAVASLRLRVRDQYGNHVPDAYVQFGLPGSHMPTFGRVRRSDESGIVEALVAQGAFDVWARAEGHAARREVIEVFDIAIEHELTLRELGRQEQLIGTVLAQSGELVGTRIFVAPRFAQPSLGADGAVVGYTDDRGVFAVDASIGDPLELFARGRQGISRRHAIERDTTNYVLELEKPGTLRIDLAADSLPGPFRSGRVEYLVVEHDGPRRERGAVSGLPFDVGPLSPGTYDVFVLAPGFDACGSAIAVEVTSGHASLVVPAQTAHWAEGRIVDAQGAPRAFFELAASGVWGPSASEFGFARTDETGWFRAFSPSPVCTLSFFGDEAPREVASVLLGAQLEVTVP